MKKQISQSEKDRRACQSMADTGKILFPCPPKKAGTTSKAFALTMLALIAGIVALCISTSVI